MFEAFANVIGKNGKLLVEVVGVAAAPGKAFAAAKRNAMRRIGELKLAMQVDRVEVEFA